MVEPPLCVEASGKICDCIHRWPPSSPAGDREWMIRCLQPILRDLECAVNTVNVLEGASAFIRVPEQTQNASSFVHHLSRLERLVQIMTGERSVITIPAGELATITAIRSKRVLTALDLLRRKYKDMR